MVRRGFAGLLVLVGCCMLAACSSSGGGTASSTSGTGSTGGSSAGDSAVQAATTALANWYTGTDRALPTSAPKPEATKNVWVISCSQAAEGCAVTSNAVQAAAKAIHWTTKIVDGGFNPSVESNGIRDAISNHADAIVLVAVDCPTVQTAVQSAKNAGIPVFGDYSIDCSEAGGGPKLLAGYASFDAAGSSYSTFQKTVHANVVADWVTAQTNGTGHVLIVGENDIPSVEIANDGIKATFPKVCPKCSLSDLNFTGQDLISGNLKSLVSAALSKDPRINVVVAPYDASITEGIGAAVQQQSGRHILVTGYEGLSANIAQIKAGGPDNLAIGFPSAWVGWSTVDQLNRIFNKQPQVDEGMGYQAVDKDHNIPTATTYYDGNVDANGKPKQNYQANFLKIWNAS